MSDRRTIGDLSETDIPYRTPRHAHRTPTCPIGHPNAQLVTGMPHWKPTCMWVPIRIQTHLF